MRERSCQRTHRKENMNDKKLNEVFDHISEDYDTVVLLTEGGEHHSVAVKGKAVDLLYVTRELVMSLREAMRNDFGAECTEALLKTVLLTRDEVKEKAEEKAKSIPSWMRRLMDLEAEADDVEDDEPDDSDDDSDEEDDDADKEEKARRKAVDDLINVLRGGISGHGSFDVSLRSK